MKLRICIRDYLPEDVHLLAELYFNTIHQVNIQDYTKKQLDVWAPKSSLEVEGWRKKFAKTKPLVATIGDEIVGFAEFELNGHIDCFYSHHNWIRKGVGSALMDEIFKRAKDLQINLIFSEVSITAKPFFESKGFRVVEKQSVMRNQESLINYKMEKQICIGEEL